MPGIKYLLCVRSTRGSSPQHLFRDSGGATHGQVRKWVKDTPPLTNRLHPKENKEDIHLFIKSYLLTSNEEADANVPKIICV